MHIKSEVQKLYETTKRDPGYKAPLFNSTGLCTWGYGGLPLLTYANSECLRSVDGNFNKCYEQGSICFPN